MPLAGQLALALGLAGLELLARVDGRRVRRAAALLAWGSGANGDWLRQWVRTLVGAASIRAVVRAPALGLTGHDGASRGTRAPGNAVAEAGHLLLLAATLGVAAQGVVLGDGQVQRQDLFHLRVRAAEVVRL